MVTGKNGSFNISTSNRYISGNVTWIETYDIASNSSVVTAEMRLSRTNTGYETYASGIFYISVNGSEVSNSSAFSFTYNSNTLCASHSVTVPHNADGSKSITISVRGQLYGIDPGLSVSEQSGTAVLTAIPRTSSLSVPSGTLGNSIRLTVNRASDSFTHTINWSAGGQSGSFTNVGAYVDWKNIPYAIANGNTSGTTVPCYFTIYTYSGGTKIGEDTASCTLTIPDNSTTKPTLEVTDIRVTNSGNISSWSEAVKGISKLSLGISNYWGSYGSTVKSYRVVSSDGQRVENGAFEVVPNTSGTYKISATVTDTRGFTSYASEKTITVYDYAPPVISSVNVTRCNADGVASNDGTYVRIQTAYSCTNINEKNTITSAVAYYRVSGSGAAYNTLGNITNGSLVLGTGQFDIGASYDIRIIVTDTIGKNDTYDTSIGTARSNIVAGLNKLGLGKYPEKDGYLEVGYKAEFKDEVYFDNPTQTRNAIGEGNGLGINVSDSDANAILATGWYRCNQNTPNAYWWYVNHIQHWNGDAEQFAFSYNDPTRPMAIRNKLDYVWQPWEWLNPPMFDNVEYQTTERFNGKPVYVRAITGTSTSGENYLGFSGDGIAMGNLISVVGNVGDYPVPTQVGSQSIYYMNWVHGSVGFTCNGSIFVGQPCRFVVKYTKD